METNTLGVDLGMFGGNRFLLISAVLNMVKDPRCFQAVTIG